MEEKKVKVYELAKELNTTSKNLMDKFLQIGIDVKSHMSPLEDEQLDKIYDYFGIKRKDVVNDNKDLKVSSDKKSLPVEDKNSKVERTKHSGPRIIRTAVREIRTDEETGVTTEVVTEIKGAKRSHITKIIENDKKQTAQELFESMNPNLKKVPVKKVEIVEEKSIEKENVSKDMPVLEENKVIKAEEKKVEEKIEDKVDKKIVDKKENNNLVTAVKSKAIEKFKKDEAGLSVVHDRENRDRGSVRKDFMPKKKTFDGNKVGQSQGSFDKKKIVKDDKPLALEELSGKAVSRKSTINREYEKRGSVDKENKSINKNRNLSQPKNKYDKFKGFEHSRASELMNSDAVLDVDEDKYSRRPKKKKNFEPKVEQKVEPVKVVWKVTISDMISVKTLAERMKKQSSEIIKKLFSYGIVATLNQEIDYDTAAIVATDMGYIVEKEVIVNEEDILFDDSEDLSENLEKRPPVVVVMGHVDHGKTSLLDAIRSTNSLDKEAGGITQHIGAYSVKINDRKITFLDTPGHEAFTAMRARGAQVTDIAILVVAADDGVKPQTIEAINHAKAANISIIVAINKIDKPEANPDRVKQQLMEYGVVAEEWGGDTIFVPVSAKKNEGIDQLLEMVLLVADMQDLKADPNKQCKGTVIESRLDKGRGAVATLLVQRGTLKTGDLVVTGNIMGKVRAMVNDKLQRIKKAGPSTPVEIIGLHEVPEAGEIFYVVDDEKTAKHLVEKRKAKQREVLIHKNRVTLDDLFEQIQQGDLKDLNIIVKADVQGSSEAVKQSLEKIENEEVRIKVIHSAVGSITESDVMLASVSNAIIIGFNVKPQPSAKVVAERDNVEIKEYSIIYDAIDAVKAAIKGMLAPKYREVVYGHAEVRQLFKISGTVIAGSYVTDGKILKSGKVRVFRQNEKLFDGKIDQLKRFKDDVKEVNTSFECGITVDKFNDFQEGDIVESYGEEEIKE